MRAALVPRALLSSSLRSSSTHALARVWRAVGFLRWLVVGEIKVKSASGGPAQRTEGDTVGLQVGCGGGSLWLGPVGVFSSPVPTGNQGPAGAATGGGVVGLTHGLRVAGCGPGRTLIGLRRPGEENTPTSAGIFCAALGLSSRLGVVGQRVVRGAQKRQIFHHRSPAPPVRDPVMSMQRPRRRPTTSRVGAVLVPECERGALQRAGQSRSGVAVDFFPVEQDRLAISGV